MFRDMHEHNGVIHDTIVRVISSNNSCYFAHKLRVLDTFGGTCSGLLCNNEPSNIANMVYLVLYILRFNFISIYSV